MWVYIKHERDLLKTETAEDRRTRTYEQASRYVDELLAQPWNEAASRHYRYRSGLKYR